MERAGRFRGLLTVAVGATVLVAGACGASPAVHGAQPTAPTTTTSPTVPVSPGATGGTTPPPTDGASTAAVGTAGGPLTVANLGTRVAAAQRKAGSYAFEMTVSAAGQKFVAQVAVSVRPGAGTATRMVMHADGQQVEVRAVRRVIYLKAPGLPGGKPWLKIDPHTGPGSSLLSALGVKSDYATSTIAPLMKARSVTREGAVTLAGIATTKYLVVVPGTAISGALTGTMASLLPKVMRYQLWIDGQDRIRQMDYGYTVPGAGRATGHLVFHQYGAAVSVVAPPASQVSTGGSKA